MPPLPRASLLAIDPYIPGKSHAPSLGKVHKLSSNETPFGPSPKALEAVREADGLEIYPEGTARMLREAIGARFGLDPARIVCGAGSDELLSFLAYAYLEPGDEGIFTRHGFLIYKIAILAAGGVPVVAEESNLTADVDSILAKVTPRTKIVYLANPNNPTGTYLPVKEVKRLQAGLPSHVLLVLDAAYAEYVQRGDYAAGLELVATCDNVVMTRTFSKIYGLAALRLGWMVGPDAVVAAVNRIRGPFNVSSLALKAGVAALQDETHLALSIAHNGTWRERLKTRIEALGLGVTPSVANFLLVHFPPERSAASADEYLSARGLILRRVEAYGLPDSLRLTIGSVEANEAVLEALRRFMEDAS